MLKANTLSARFYARHVPLEYERIWDAVNAAVDGDHVIIHPGRYQASDFYDYLQTGILPDPNLIDPNMLNWGSGNHDVDPLFAAEPNDAGDGWAPIINYDEPWDKSPFLNNWLWGL